MGVYAVLNANVEHIFPTRLPYGEEIHALHNEVQHFPQLWYCVIRNYMYKRRDSVSLNVYIMIKKRCAYTTRVQDLRKCIRPTGEVLLGKISRETFR